MTQKNDEAKRKSDPQTNSSFNKDQYNIEG